MDKHAIREAIITLLEAELALQTEAALTSREEATDEESRAEDKYDMRSQSAAYLAAGQAKFATEIADAIAAYRNLVVLPQPTGSPIAMGALVVLRSGARTQHYFLGPARGGLDVEVSGQSVTVVTLASPLGNRLLGRVTGDMVLLPGRPAPQAYTIERVL